MLRKKGIQHNVLNAKYHEKRSGNRFRRQVSMVQLRIATNMAGRGTDIKLDEEARAAGGFEKLSVRNATNPDELITSCAVVQDVRVIRVNQDFTFHLKMT
mgnify:CR=1 FL=1